MELALCMIVRDEEACLARCLESVREVVDEIVILDTGSKDATKQIARRYTQHVYDYVWMDDFADARNTAFSYATKPYLLWMDADDVLETSEREKLKALKPSLNGSVDAVMMPYVCDVRPDGKPSLLFYRERIVRADAGFLFIGAVHEAMPVSGCVIREEIQVRHMGQHGAASHERNLAIYEKWIASGSQLSARDWVYYARELMVDGRDREAEEILRRAQTLGARGEILLDAQLQRAHCLLRLERIMEARAQLLCALAAACPSAELLCTLGLCEMQAGRNDAAVFWYRAARLCEGGTGNGFLQADYSDYIPSMQLCVLLDRMGRNQEAAMENERALIARPGDEAALANRVYFAEKRCRQEKRTEQEKTAELMEA